MVILLAYCLRGLPLADPAQALRGVAALAVTVVLHRRQRSAVLSILGGTAVALCSLSRWPRTDSADPDCGPARGAAC